MARDKKKRSLGVRHDPLHVQLSKDASLELGRGGKPRKKGDDGRGPAPEELATSSSKKSGFVDSKTSKKILEIVRRQQDEVEREDGFGEDDDEEVEAGAGESVKGAAGFKRISMAVDSDEEVEEEEFFEDGEEKEWPD
ncbi:hypothetical protein BDK51DRAFT_38069 [Blyttiomyces helicus]|uniref:Uncharacterized protein n=1 Tax=Blyttiomyces helicus TaxID=388810 RepID=A0A4P9W5K8_9FUNG|nr:hypothetical protein BDK51DRAFT_38069 [Blyttiomyces helicus]|eukprot:RKO86613.1 hypothetical protein BDK51DRAFT_38069 [Blyttiomyces helicus]